MSQEELLDSTIKEVSCSLCLEMLKEPKVLSCGHSFCLQCLQLNERSQGTRKRLDCPECRFKTIIPSGDVKNLPNNYAARNLLKALIDARESCVKLMKCQVCEENCVFQGFCSTCDVWLCKSCTKSHQKYLTNHTTQDAKKAIETKLKETSQVLEDFHEILTKNCDNLDTLKQVNSSTVKEMKLEINKTAEKYHTLIDEQKIELIKEVERLHEKKIQEIKSEKRVTIEKQELIKKFQESLEKTKLSDNFEFHLEQFKEIDLCLFGNSTNELPETLSNSIHWRPSPIERFDLGSLYDDTESYIRVQISRERTIYLNNIDGKESILLIKKIVKKRIKKSGVRDSDLGYFFYRGRQLVQEDLTVEDCNIKTGDLLILPFTLSVAEERKLMKVNVKVRNCYLDSEDKSTEGTVIREEYTKDGGNWIDVEWKRAGVYCQRREKVEHLQLA